MKPALLVLPLLFCLLTPNRGEAVAPAFQPAPKEEGPALYLPHKNFFARQTSLANAPSFTTVSSQLYQAVSAECGGYLLSVHTQLGGTWVTAMDLNGTLLSSLRLNSLTNAPSHMACRRTGNSIQVYAVTSVAVGGSQIYSARFHPSAGWTLLWQSLQPGYLSGLTLENGRLFLSSGGPGGTVQALDASSGGLLWSYSLPVMSHVSTEITVSPTLGRVIFGTGTALFGTGTGIVCLDGSGTPVWTLPFRVHGKLALSPDGLLLYGVHTWSTPVGSVDGMLGCVDVATGSVLWVSGVLPHLEVFPGFPLPPLMTPLVDHSRVYVACGAPAPGVPPSIRALDRLTGQGLWTHFMPYAGSQLPLPEAVTANGILLYSWISSTPQQHVFEALDATLGMPLSWFPSPVPTTLHRASAVGHGFYLNVGNSIVLLN